MQSTSLINHFIQQETLENSNPDQIKPLRSEGERSRTADKRENHRAPRTFVQTLRTVLMRGQQQANVTLLIL